jgi:hypothetical protein
MDKGEKGSVEAKDFIDHLKNFHEGSKKHINKMNSIYKAKVDKKKRYKEF